MQAALLRRLGLCGDACDRRLAWALVLLALGLYTIGYASHYPRVFTNNDEGRYAAETRAFLDTGSIFVPKTHPLTGETESVAPGDYPFGMIALMAPFVEAFGWRGAFFPSFLCLLIAVLATARWLQEERRSPVFALVLLGFPAALVAGRLAMSDSARTAVAALGLWLFFRGLDRHKGWWLASGFVAGAALSLRESAVLPFVPLFAGALLRRDRGWIWLLLGGLAGTAAHLAGNQILFGTPLFVRGAVFYPFDAAVWDRLWLYLVGLLVFVPGGLLLGLDYRGRRRPEVVATIALFFLFYLFQAYGMVESGTLKRIVTALRYFAPLLPLLAFAMAETLPRRLAGIAARSAAAAAFERRAGVLAALWIAGVAAASLAVHPGFARWSASQAEIRDAIERNVPRDAVMIGNGAAIRKFADEYAREFVILSRLELAEDDTRALAARHPDFFVVFLDRSDSDYWRGDAARNAEFVERLPGAPQLLVDIQPTATDRLRIWRVAAGENQRDADEAARR
jgi:4-amino-4-deoxy-L-arabinose transferase-like glycosyltransferase